MQKGVRPSGKSAATMNREREKEEKTNPEKRQRRMEDDDCKKINFFAGHTRATVSAGVDTIGAVVLDSVAVLVHETLPDITDRLENRLSLDQKVRNLCLWESCCLPH